MIINKEFLNKLKPCSDRYKNHLEHYSKFEGSFDEFIDLDNVPYSDKTWVARKVLNKNQLCHFGLLCAESVLHIFEEKYPNDKRVGDCIRYLKTIKNFEDLTRENLEEIRNHDCAAYAAYTDADAAYAASAAYAAYAAASAAYAAYAAYAAAAAAYAAADADAAYAAAAARKNQEYLNLEFLKMASSL